MLFHRYFMFFFLFWPLYAALGGSGSAAMLGLCFPVALFYARFSNPPIRIYAVMASLALIWAVSTYSWSSVDAPLYSGNLLNKDFAIKSSGARVALLAAIAAIVLMAVLKTRQFAGKRSRAIIIGAFSVNSVIAIVWSIAYALKMQSASELSEIAALHEAYQNVLRNANTFALILPLLLAILWHWQKRVIGKIAAIGLVVFSIVSMRMIGTEAGLIAVGSGLVGLAIAKIWPWHGIRIALFGFAAYIVAAPALIYGLIKGIAASGMEVPASFQSRLWGWETVIDHIVELPLYGGGLESSKTWDETYASRPDWLAQLPDFWASYKIVPGHPHNMGLQIWAETGAVGAILAALTLILIALRLPYGARLSPVVRYGSIGLICAIFPIFCFSYSVWNDGFWGAIILIIASLMILEHTEKATP